MGDAASAVVVGRVSPGHGIRGFAFHADGSLHGGFVSGVPGGRWYDDAPVVAYNADRGASRRMILRSADVAKDVVDRALASAGCTHRDVRFYASHQPTSWMRRVTQEHIGLDCARSVDTFRSTGNIIASGFPLQLAEGVRQGILGEGDVVAMFSIASGMSAAGVVLQWGA
jgi:3-oxoacyl-[acyl-carrier-protein] synthase-3